MRVRACSLRPVITFALVLVTRPCAGASVVVQCACVSVEGDWHWRRLLATGSCE